MEYPDDLDLYTIRAAAYWYDGRLDGAVQDYTKVLLDSGSQRHAQRHSQRHSQRHAYLGRGHILAEQGEFEAALDDTEEAVKLAREAGDVVTLAYALNGRAAAVAGLGRLDEALADFSESLRLCPANAWAHYNRAVALERAGRSRDAVAGFEKALELEEPPLTERQRRVALSSIRRNARCQG